MSAIPKLRFPEFDGEWVRSRIDEIGTLKSGVGFPEKEQGGVEGTPFYKVSDMNIPENSQDMVLANNYVTEEQIKRLKYKPIAQNSIIFAKVGAAIFLDRKRKARNFLFDNNMMAFLPSSEIDFRFIYQEFLQINLAKFVQVGALPSYNASDIGIIKVEIPSLPEQQKIASFLSSVDKKIDLLRQKKDALELYKKGLMHKIFSQEIRFKQEDGGDFPDWEEVALNEIAKRSTEKNKDLELTLVLTNSAVQGVVIQTEYFDKSIANEANISGYYKIRKYDFVYNPRISSSAPVGPISQNLKEDGVMSPLYTIFKVEVQYQDFLSVCFKTSVWYDYMRSVANQGARHDRMNITTSDFMALPIDLPCAEERKKIADFLSELDAKIQNSSSQIEQMETFKKGLLQQMFV